MKSNQLFTAELQSDLRTREANPAFAQPSQIQTNSAKRGIKESIKMPSRILVSALSALVLLIGAAAAQPRQLDRTTAHAQWRESIINSETPGEGCFQATFPATQWEPAPCRAVSEHTHPIPRRSRSHEPQTTGDGNDYALVADGLLISQTVGSLPSVTGVTSESSVGVQQFGDGGILGPNEYSLQINSNANLGSAACSGGAAGCTIWQQFIYATDYEGPGSAAVFIQYWLLGYGANGARCPSGFGTYGTDCFKNSPYVTVPDVPITGLGNLKMTGAAVKGGNDTVTFANGSQAYSVSASDSVLDLATVWEQSEFNVVGDAGGSEAEFNTGTQIAVNVAAQYGSTSAPACASNAGTTGETNNLDLSPCVTAGGTTPSIQFTESLTWILSGEFDSADTKNSVYYLGPSFNLYQLGWDEGWTWNQETGTGGRPSVAAGTGISAYVNTIYDGNESFYLSTVNGNLHIWQLWGSPAAPSPTDLTAHTSGKSVAPGTSPAGFIDAVRSPSTDNLFFIGADQFIHVLYWSPSGGWQEDPTLDSTAMTAAAAASPLSSHMTASSEEVFYLGQDQHIHEVWRWSKTFDGWHTTDVTEADGAKPLPVVGSPLAGFYDSTAAEDAMFYIGPSQHVYELRFTGEWSYTDLTATTSGTTAASIWTPLVAHLDTVAKSEEAFFLDSNQNVQELWASSTTPTTWYASNVTVASGNAPAAFPGSPLATTVSTIDNTDHVFYIGADQNILELWWNGTWHNADDTTQTSPESPNPAP